MTMAALARVGCRAAPEATSHRTRSPSVAAIPAAALRGGEASTSGPAAARLRSPARLVGLRRARDPAPDTRPFGPLDGGVGLALHVAARDGRRRRARGSVLVLAHSGQADLATAIDTSSGSDLSSPWINPPEPPELRSKYFGSPAKKGVPVYVMLPLDTVTIINTLNHAKALNAGLRALKSIGVDGIMVDVWWGIVEAAGPGQYDWSSYKALVRMAAAAGLQMQVVMSFHACGCNVGDNCTVSLPPWVLAEAARNPDVLYTDRRGHRNDEYLSWGVDEQPLFGGRTPLQMYEAYMRDFRATFAEYLGSVITEVEVSLGPAGELRYPSYPDSRWQYPGVGEFQCYDKYQLASLRAAAEAIGRPEWGNGGPHDAGDYNSLPHQTGFFQENGSWSSPYGDFFLSWYSSQLISHGDRILAAAGRAFDGAGVVLAAKLPGIHWWFRTRSHAAELTAGIYNPRGHDGYGPIMRMLAAHSAMLNFTCVEMADAEQSAGCHCGPEGLLLQVRLAAARARVPVAAENALARFDEASYNRIIHNCNTATTVAEVAHAPRPLGRMASFTFLRMGERLFQPDNWGHFVRFVRNMERAAMDNPPPERGSEAAGGNSAAAAAVAAAGPVPPVPGPLPVLPHGDPSNSTRVLQTS